MLKEYFLARADEEALRGGSLTPMNLVPELEDPTSGNSYGKGDIESHPPIVHPASRNRKLNSFVLSSGLYLELSRTAEERHLEPSAFLFTAFYELLCRWQPTTHVEFRRGTVLFRSLSLESSLPVCEAIRLVQRTMESAAPGSSSAAALDGEFSFLNKEDAGAPHQSASPIHLSVRSAGKVLSGSIDYDCQTWSQSAIERLAKHYEYLLCSALFRLDAPLEDLEILRASDIETLERWNQTSQPYPHSLVDQLFQQQVERRPDYPAVSFEGKTLTYRALAEQTAQLATRLQKLGVGPGALVGVCMNRSNEMVIALLAIFRAGGAYLPLDPGFPADRIAFMQEDARPAVVITESTLRDKFSFPAAAVFCFDSCFDPAALDGSQIGSITSGASLDDLAYVLYTSGSTGKPKGVPVTNRALTNLLSAVIPEISLSPGDVFLATSTISFDISAFELFAPLIAGAHLVVASRAVTVSGELLADAIQTTHATVLQATPSGWRILLEAGWKGQPGFKLLTAGEPLDRTLAHRLLERGAGLWNLYGPTEATIYASGCRVSGDGGKMTVGRPLANYTAYVLDKNRKRLPIGAIGELYLGGVGLAQGYLNRPELTAEKFIPNPFSDGRESRLYRSGDLARFLEDGQIELLGRADNQVKLRGYRIELEEIEARLDSHPSVRKSVVKVLALEEGDQRLVAYVVPRDPGLLDEGLLRDFASSALPSYMVPGLFVAVAAFSLTPNGKVDRKALLVPAGLQSKNPAAQTSGQPTDDFDEALLACWRSVLSIPDLGLDYNFFEMGGHSLLAARLFARLTKETGLKLPIGLLVEAPTPRLLSERIRQMQRSPIGCLVPMQIRGGLAPLYMIHHLLGDILLYRTLADCFAPHRPVIGVQAPVDLTDKSKYYSLEALSNRYVQEILEQQAEGPFHLAGFSSGSALAFEMARQFVQRGHTVGMLALIDGDVNGPRPHLSKVGRYWKISVRKFCKIAFKLKDELKDSPAQFVGKRLRFLHLLWKTRTVRAAYESGQAIDLTIEQKLALAEHSYQPQPYSGSALLIRFHDEAWQYGPDPLMGWSELVRGGIEVVDLPGGHMTGMGPLRAPHTASVLTSHMERVEALRLDPNRLVFAGRDAKLTGGVSSAGGERTEKGGSRIQNWRKKLPLSRMAVRTGTASLAGSTHTDIQSSQAFGE